MSLNDYQIIQLTYNQAMEIIVKEHYLHRKAPCSFAYGLIDKDHQIKGVICYGTPSSSTLRRGIAGDENINNVIELTRLWVCDSVPKNGESYLIGNTIRLIDKEIVVSYAEDEQGHKGIVYQATNWYYTGLSAKRTNWVIDGINKHCQTLADKYTAKEIREIYGDRFSLQPRPRKHRYFFINAPKYRKKHLLKQIKYKIEPYPK